MPGCNGSFVGRGRSDSSGNFAVASFVLAEGSYDFSVQAVQGDKTSCSASSLVYNLDITPPSIVISAPSASLVGLGSAAVNFTMTYSGSTSVNLTADKITLNKTGTANCSGINITNGTTLNPQMSLSNCSGNGTVGFTIAYGSALDDVGNSATATSSLFNVDNNAITSAVFNPANRPQILQSQVLV